MLLALRASRRVHVLQVHVVSNSRLLIIVVVRVGVVTHPARLLGHVVDVGEVGHGRRVVIAAQALDLGLPHLDGLVPEESGHASKLGHFVFLNEEEGHVGFLELRALLEVAVALQEGEAHVGLSDAEDGLLDFVPRRLLPLLAARTAGF